MFGYLVVHKPELKVKEVDWYRSYYCGLCRELRERGGIPGQISLTYDLTFVTILLTALYELPTKQGKTRCVIHPILKHPIRKNEATEYAADMNLLLTYYKCKDDWNDEKKVHSAGYGALLKQSVRRIEEAYPEKAENIRRFYEDTLELEKKKEGNLDELAGASGRMLGEVLAWKKDEWESSLRKVGFYLGKFIYLLDAYDDVEKDQKSGSYNVFSEEYQKEEFPEKVKMLLTMMISEACREFEKLPIIKYADLLRNILYAGVWSRYEMITTKRKKEQEKRKK
ncbi:MAG: DUF5685 family protein [Eubacteriales bacterium]|nr:DUF5685 family protein [Eubacteriales bacterium]